MNDLEERAEQYYAENFGSAWDSNKSKIIDALVDFAASIQPTDLLQLAIDTERAVTFGSPDGNPLNQAGRRAAILKTLQAHRGFDEATETRWQKAIYELCKKILPDVDGSGCESGDALDVTISEVRQCFAHLQDERDSLRSEREIPPQVMQILERRKDCLAVLDKKIHELCERGGRR